MNSHDARYEKLIEMGFSPFAKEGRTHRPSVTIVKQGTLGINRPAMEKFDLASVDYVVLMYDAAQKRIAIYPVASGDAPGAIKLRHRSVGGGADISARAFLEKFDIPYGDRSRKCSVLEESKQLGVMVCELPTE